jgi:hypothetical protein
MHQRQPPPSIFLDRPDAPRELVDICAKMMAKKPDERYQSADEVAKVLAQWLVAQGQRGNSAGGGDSSSGALAGATVSQQVAPVGDMPPARRLPKNTSLPPRGSGRLPRPAGMPPLPSQPPSASDTASNLNRATVQMTAASQRAGNGPSGSRPPARRSLPKARRLEPRPAPIPLLIAEDDLPPVFLTKQRSRSKEVDFAGALIGHVLPHKWLFLAAAGGVIALLFLALRLLTR